MELRPISPVKAMTRKGGIHYWVCGLGSLFNISFRVNLCFFLFCFRNFSFFVLTFFHFVKDSNKMFLCPLERDPAKWEFASSCSYPPILLLLLLIILLLLFLVLLVLITPPSSLLPPSLPLSLPPSLLPLLLLLLLLLLLFCSSPSLLPFFSSVSSFFLLNSLCFFNPSFCFV